MTGRRAQPRGAILIFAMLFIFLVLIFATIGVDYGNGIFTKNAALANSESSADSGLVEFYRRDYEQLGDVNPIGNPFVWRAYTTEEQARLAVNVFGRQTPVGSTTLLVDSDGRPIDPNDPDGPMRASFADPDETNSRDERAVAYRPDIQPNNLNFFRGDIHYGIWEQPAGSSRFHFRRTPNPEAGEIADLTPLPTAIRVFIRRTYQPKEEGVSEGDNQINFTFGRTLRGFAVNSEDPTETAAQLRNRGIRLILRNTVALCPAASIATGREVTRQNGDTARVGIFPFAIKHSLISNFIVTQNYGVGGAGDINIAVPAVNSGTAQGYFTDFGIVSYGTDPADRVRIMIDFAAGFPITPLQVPPQVTIGDVVGASAMNTVTSVQRIVSDNLVTSTWIIPVVNDASQCVGFARVYNPRIAGQVITLRLAPSAAHHLATRHLDGNVNYASISSDFNGTFWQTTRPPLVPTPFVAQPYGVCCATMTVQYHDINTEPDLTE